jgi:hypothetical protein
VVVCLDNINYPVDMETLNGMLYTLIPTCEEYPDTRMGGDRSALGHASRPESGARRLRGLGRGNRAQ